jgi:iron complex transport system substrate-binding protein
MNKDYLTFLIIISTILFSCNVEPQKNTQASEDFYQPKYADFFRIAYFKDYKKISIINPWGNSALDINYFITKKTEASKFLNKKDLYITDYPKKIVALSSPMVGLLHLLELDSSIVGISDPELIYNEKIRQEVLKGNILNVGKSTSVNMETILSLQPDLIIGSGWDKLSPDFERMIQLKLTPLLIYDWKETHPLGKAEWMVFVAAFFDQEEKAMAKFNEIEDSYNRLKNDFEFNKSPSILNGSEYQGIWYSAGGQSYISQLYKDARGSYIMMDDSSSGSLMLDFEVIMKKAEKVDIWMYTGSTDNYSLDKLRSAKYQTLNAVRNHRVYSYHKKLLKSGANAYWETASYRPDLVLEDLIKIFHHSAPSNMHYFDKVEF